MESSESRAALMELLADHDIKYQDSPIAYEEPFNCMKLELAGASEGLRGYLEAMLPILVKYLESPIITDEFEDHAERREAEDMILEEIQKAGIETDFDFGSNKLGINTFNNMFPIITGVSRFLTEEDRSIPAVQRMLELANELPGTYGEGRILTSFSDIYAGMPLDGECPQFEGRYRGKLGFAEEMTRVVQEFVELCR